MKKIILNIIRICFGWIFLWAFFDKLLGLGFATPAERAWINGGSPTYGFLTNATKGPFEEFFKMLAGQGFVDWIFMIGLLLIGLSFISGIWVKYSGWATALLLFLMYLAGFLPPENNPIIDDHIIYALIAIYFAVDSKEKEKNILN